MTLSETFQSLIQNGYAVYMRRLTCADAMFIEMYCMANVKNSIKDIYPFNMTDEQFAKSLIDVKNKIDLLNL